MMFHCLIVCLLFQYVFSTLEVPKKPPPCAYPTGSIACKTWNQTNVDCAERSLTCIPRLPHAASVELLDLERNKISVLPDDSFIEFHNLITLYLGFNQISFIGNHTFSGLGKLELLDLGSNEISFIGKHTFSGLHKLKNLDLQSNRIRIVSGSPFHSLNSLKTLYFWYGNDDSKPLLTASFAGLTCLEELQLHITSSGSIENVSFQELSILDTLKLTTYYGVYVFRHASGLSQLKNLRISNYFSDESELALDLCNFSALENVYLDSDYIYVSNKCNTSSLRSFTVVWHWQYQKDVGFEKLHNVTSITVTFYNDYKVQEELGFVIQALQLLNSPVEKLTFVCVKYYICNNLVFNSTYFKPLALFNSSLRELSLKVETCDIKLQGSPFNHFPKLKMLSIICNSLHAITSSNRANVFEGLENLQELHLNCSDSCSLGSRYIYFSMYVFQSLKSLSILQSRPGPGDPSYLDDAICTMQSLQYLDLFSDMFFRAFCVLPHIQTIIWRNGYLDWYWYLDWDVSEMVPHVEKIDFSGGNLGSIKFFYRKCPYVRVINFSHATWSVSIDDTFDMPLLEELYLSDFDLYDMEGTTMIIFDFLRRFKTPNLRYLDISYNSISVITRDQAMLLSNLTFLDLSGNDLGFFDYVQYLVNIETLILKANFFTTFPGPLFADSYKPLLKVLDLSDNRLACDCDIQAFQLWMITDLRVRLLRNPKYDMSRTRCSYCCASPEAREGLSVTEIDLDCKSLLWAYIVIGVISTIFLIIIGLLVALYHWNIKNRLVLLLNRRRDPVVYLLDDDDHDDEDENGIPRYDAYVSYCNEDDDWICDEFDPTIEGGAEPLRLCIRGRDIPANRPILQSISLYMKRSRKVVLILSPRYVDNRGRNQCKFELALAHQRLQEENENVLILILLEEIPDRQMTLMLRQLFNRVLCLKWPGNECEQGLFWQWLREELKRRVPVDEYYEAQHPQAIELQRVA